MADPDQQPGAVEVKDADENGDEKFSDFMSNPQVHDGVWWLKFSSFDTIAIIYEIDNSIVWAYGHELPGSGFS